MDGRPRSPSGRPSLRSGGLDAIEGNRTLGARALSLRTLRVIEREANAWTKEPRGRQRNLARFLSRRLRAVQPAMAPFASWALEVEHLARTTGRSSLAARLRQWVGSTRRRLLAEPRGIARVVRRSIPPGARLLTFSRSASVSSAILALGPRQRPSRVVALESRPGGEGRALARELLRGGVRARCVRDGTADRALARADLLVVGADAIEKDGTLVHKVGTRRLARLARKAGVPFVVVAGTSKWVPLGGVPRKLPPLFDRTPAGLVSAYWTDRGVVPGRRSARPA